ncbi:MAG: hypothetical protein FJ030_06445 [Chloroflexi bacterium]|nr:hypothetical protein [Chloroflexota bacterium]
MAPPQRAVINLAPQHKFKHLGKWPESQLLMQVPRVLWNHTRQYVPHFEAVHLAGRFGAEQGDYEWEVIAEPQGLKWWRRTVGGDAAYCAFTVAPDVSTDPVEVFGLIDIASDTPWWFDACDDMVQIETRGNTLAHQHRLNEHEGQVIISIRDEYGPRRLITAERDENGAAWRVGSAEEVDKLKNAFVGLVNRARTAVLPEEALRKTGELKPKTAELTPPNEPPKPKTDELKKPTTGSLKENLSSLFKPKTDQLKKP